MNFRVYCLAFQVEGLEGEQVADEGARAPLPGRFSFTTRVVRIHKKPLYLQYNKCVVERRAIHTLNFEGKSTSNLVEMSVVKRLCTQKL